MISAIIVKAEKMQIWDGRWREEVKRWEWGRMLNERAQTRVACKAIWAQRGVLLCWCVHAAVQLHKHKRAWRERSAETRERADYSAMSSKLPRLENISAVTQQISATKGMIGCLAKLSIVSLQIRTAIIEYCDRSQFHWKNQQKCVVMTDEILQTIPMRAIMKTGIRRQHHNTTTTHWEYCLSIDNGSK